MLRSVFFVFIAVCAFSCNEKSILGDSQDFGDSWKAADTATFKIPSLDTLQRYNVILNVRNTNDYKFNNIFLIASIQFPHGKTIVDTLEYKMAAPDGSWLGEGIGNIKDNRLLYKENVIFNESGGYALKLTHAVRNNGEINGVKDLEGITDVGYTIEKATQE